MPFATIPDHMERKYLDLLAASGTLDAHLYVNDLTPDPNTVWGDFIEASYPGYTFLTWDPAPATTDGAGKATTDTVVFDFTGPTSGGPVDVYGWVLTDPFANVVACGRFSGAPKTLTDDTDHAKFDVTLRAWDAHQP